MGDLQAFWLVDLLWVTSTMYVELAMGYFFAYGLVLLYIVDALNHHTVCVQLCLAR